MQTAFVTGADRGLGFAITAGLVQQGWRVIAGQFLPSWPELGTLKARYPERLQIVLLDIGSDESVATAAALAATFTDRLDLLISNAGISSPTSNQAIREPQDYAEMHRMYDVNALGGLRIVGALLPLLDAGAMKRLCFVSSEAGSIGRTTRTAMYGYCMSKAALNMATHILFNDLRPQGYTFRVYHPGWLRTYMRGEKSTRGNLEPGEAAVPALAYFLADRDDEDRLVLRDWQGEEWPW
jgi:NAD(P)-dependent dehydrogenase (short-subunit alcohol dehydrogenase family)